MNIQNLKIGDKLLCKKDFFFIGTNFYKGREYEIYNIRKIEDEYFNYYSYSLIDNINSELLYLIDADLDDIFYSVKEMRDMKLKKINEHPES